MTEHPRTIHPIELESYEIMRKRVDTDSLPPLTRAVLERVIHASADIDYRTDLVCDEATLATAHAVLHGGDARIVVDAEMVASGITSRKVRCYVRDSAAARLSLRAGITRSAAAMRIALTETGPGAIWVIGNAPTALFELLNLDAKPTLIIGLPVGFVGAAEAKRALRDSGLPAITNISEKGGSSVAAAAVNALLYFDPLRGVNGTPDVSNTPRSATAGGLGGS
jgi:precorrin-8X/cobalt-precorrin-8 methylmutase